MTPEINMKMDDNSYLYRSQKQQDGNNQANKNPSW